MKNCDFLQAVRCVESGGIARRKGWEFATLIKQEDGQIRVKNGILNYSIRAEDVLAEDWELKGNFNYD